MRLDALTVEILRNYLQGAVEEMAYVVERTAYTTFVKETADFTCGLLNPSGKFFAYPVELGVASFGGISYAETLEAVGPLEPGDVVITNDPYGSAAAATHLPDIHLVKPIFWDNRLVPTARASCTAPTSAHGAGVDPPRASEIFQEGLRLPPKALQARRGQSRPARRDPRQLSHPRAELGRSAGAGCRAHHRRAPDARADPPLRPRHGRQGDGRPDRLRDPQGQALIRGCRPDAEFADYIEDDVVSKIPIRLKVALTIADGEIHLDFTGSDIQVSSALNVPTAGKVHPFMSVALVNYFATRDRTIPLNAGVLRRVRMTLPEGSVVNPKFPAACGVRYATVLRIYDAVLGALARAVPEDIPAASGGQGCMVALSLPDPAAGRRHVTVIEPMIGGGGGRPARDGVDGCDASLGFLKTTPAETLEAEVPIVVRRFHLIPDSAGPGPFRGGFGVRMALVFQPGPGDRARMERLRFAPWGVAGGTAGATGSVMLNPGTAGRSYCRRSTCSRSSRRRAQRPDAGRRWSRRSLHRPPSTCSPTSCPARLAERARESYGVVLDGDRVDESATTSPPPARGRTARGPRAVFDSGGAPWHERRWPPALQDAFIALLMSLPAPMRVRPPHALRSRRGLAAERPVTPDDLDRLLKDLRASIALK
jgi:N-methylhydantoinase B